ncbi:hypothetical protein PDJAM_G00139410 [Pangasius djambal]|uniref:Uncharacterized protein n=1 Tax=Pangasius djambal TaxID=1691987 RepID=A0ACC5ZDI0_9TELE|nr:hypothetical protein [Pangasius djambal]
MAASEGSSVWDTPRVYKHHEQQKVCHTRPKYREGRRLKAVKVYTINLESRFLLVQGVPAIEDIRKKLQDRRRYMNRACIKSETECEKEPTGSKKPVESSEPASTPWGNGNSAQTESSNPNTYSGIPLLPLPPQEEAPQQCLSSRGFKSHSLQTSAPTEDKMGSLHHFIPASPELSKQNSHQPNPASAGTEERDRTEKSKNPPSTAPRFIPRTARLENRKRKMEESMDLLGMSDKNAPLFGPKLPEQQRMDMEDDSLNITANLIRQTLAKVSSVPTETKTTSSTTTKPRRRI